MIKVCHNSVSAIYDDGNNWIWKIKGQNDQIIPKSYLSLLPLAAVIKYEMIPDNQKILNELRLLARKEMAA